MVYSIYMINGWNIEVLYRETGGIDPAGFSQKENQPV